MTINTDYAQYQALALQALSERDNALSDKLHGIESKIEPEQLQKLGELCQSNHSGEQSTSE